MRMHKMKNRNCGERAHVNLKNGGMLQFRDSDVRVRRGVGSPAHMMI